MDTHAGNILMIINEDGRDESYYNLFHYNNLYCDIEHQPLVGLQKAIQHHYDIIILEDYLNNSSGYILAKEILNNKFALIFMLGQYADNVSVIGAYRVGIADYILKDAPIIQLCAKCESTINRIALQTKNTSKHKFLISVGSITLNTNNGELMVDGIPKEPLVKKEVEVLQFLLLHPDEYLSKKTIYESVWGETYFEKENSVGNYISRIRRKLGDFELNEPRFIETKRNCGFKLKSHQWKPYC